MSCSDTKNYAVVQFSLDSTFSEVPINWLTKINDIDYCWWPPRSSNNATLIANCTNPNYKIWNKYKVDIIKQCTSLQSARRSAADSNYNTTDDEYLGRGKRAHISYTPYTETNSDDEVENTSKRRKKDRTHCQSTSSVLPSCPNNFELYVDQQDAGSSTSRDKTATSQSEIRNSEISENSSHAQERTLPTIPVVIEDVPELAPLQTKELFNMHETLKEVKRMVAVCNVTLRDNTERLKKLEDAIRSHTLQQPLENDTNFIVELFPLKTIADITNIEDLLQTNKEAVIQFKRFLLKIGGNNPKDNIQRILKNIFTNKCAMDCSWKGKKNNFKICDLKLIKIIKREVILRHVTLTEAEIENIMAEWLRFAKQRHQRETKDKENVPLENEEDLSM